MRSRFCLQICAAGALYALLLLSGSSWSASAADAKPLTAILLIARADLPDPNFGDSVVLVMNNLGPAPVGIIINRPTPIPVSRLFPELKQLAKVSDKVYFGGPVDIDSVWFLFRAATPPGQAVQAFDDVYLSSDRQLLLKLLGRDKPMASLRIIVGHAGWAPGQIDAEIAGGDWTLRRAEVEAIFGGTSEHPWPSPAPAPAPAPAPSPKAPKIST